ncbi:MAG: response regulator transcription factor [Candidatus Dormibacteraeota bacterium]|uniref:Response regulator transcription factor n=1 Tax=Candidatus Amunia macphersoniae TaxID=3127014 RepID=A0A934NGW4_9BACT|nr:response regulator transcription factor [Candidatus Dormibacteraeota bacterium]
MIRVLIAEDQALLREALRDVLSRAEDIDVVATCERGDQIAEQAVATVPDVALLDVELPGMDGIQAASLLRDAVPACRALILTVFGRPGYLRRALDSGALGFVLKDTPPQQLIDAIRRTAAGERVVDRDLAVAALEHGHSPLTERERDVLALSREVAGTADIAAQLHLTEGTVRNYLSAAMQKLEVTSRAEAARMAEQHGWL